MGEPVVMTLLHREVHRLGIPAEAYSALHGETRDVIETACLDRVRYDLDEAIEVAREVRASGSPWTRRIACPFCHGFHAREVPDMEEVEAWARAIRDLGGDRPTSTGVDDPGGRPVV